MWIYIFGALLILGVILAYAFGILTPISTFKDKLKRPTLLYYSWKGTKMEIRDQFQIMRKDRESCFKLSNNFAICYNLSEQIWKFVMGIMVNQGESNRIQTFLKDHPQYKLIRLKGCRYIGFQFPYINAFSFLFRAWKLEQFHSKLAEQNVLPSKALIQIYHFLPSSGKTLEIINPIQNEEQWQLYEDY